MAKRVDWDAVGLGTRPDMVIAREVGCDGRAVRHARAKRGIPAFDPRKPKTLAAGDGESAAPGITIDIDLTSRESQIATLEKCMRACIDGQITPSTLDSCTRVVVAAANAFKVPSRETKKTKSGGRKALTFRLATSADAEEAKRKRAENVDEDIPTTVQ